MARTRQFKELSHCQVAVWCALEPGIDPAQWARLCRLLGHLSPAQFREFLQHLCRRPLINRASESVGHLPAAAVAGAEDQDVPMLSLGPSGIGGEFQKEM